MMNESIHQNLIGGTEGPPGCLYLQFRAVRQNLQDFKSSHVKRESLPKLYWILHIVAGCFAAGGIWEVFRWCSILPTWLPEWIR
jgi:hypothetical protein